MWLTLYSKSRPQSIPLPAMGKYILVIHYTSTLYLLFAGFTPRLKAVTPLSKNDGNLLPNSINFEYNRTRNFQARRNICTFASLRHFSSYFLGLKPAVERRASFQNMHSQRLRSTAQRTTTARQTRPFSRHNLRKNLREEDNPCWQAWTHFKYEKNCNKG